VSALRRVLLVAAIAALAVVPLRAFGVVGAGAPSGLSVSASLGGCGVAGEGIVCQIDVSFGGVEGADHYTASVTRADGSVQDLGTVGSGEGGGSASVSVPYVGAGNYSVTVSAWGDPDEEGGKPELLDRERTGTSERRHTGDATAEPADEGVPEPGPDGEAPAPETAPPPEAVAPETAETGAPEPPGQSLPECRPDAAAAAQAPMDGSDAPAAEPQAAAPAPVVECTAPSSDANGPCCPPGT
jgi:hypothetical protein